MENIGISIGNVCNSAIYGVINKLRKSKKDGYLTCPFDLMVSNFNGIILCLEEDFKDFCNPEYLNLVDNKIIQNTKYNFGFNHESPTEIEIFKKQKWKDGPNHFIINKFEKFIDRYNNRINNFRNYLNSGNKIIFIFEFYYDKEDEVDFSKFYNVIHEKYPNLDYEIHIVNN